MIGRLLKALKPDRQDIQHAATEVSQSVLGKLAKKVLPHGVGKPSLDELGKKKLYKSGGLAGAALVLVNLLVGAPWYPEALTSPEMVSFLTAGITLLLNVARKLVVRYAPAVIVEEIES